MIRSDAFNSRVDPVKTKITGKQHIPILHVCYSYKSESKGFIVDENSSQVCSLDESDS